MNRVHHLRRSVLLLALLASIASYVGVPTTHAAVHGAAADLIYVHIRLDEPISAFTALSASSTRDAWFDWSTDLCSAPLVGNTGRSFNFTESCRRHDFAYRNLHRIEWRYGVDTWNAAERLRADRRFLTDMLSHCAGRSVLLRPTCRGWAYTFYYVVRSFGDW